MRPLSDEDTLQYEDTPQDTLLALSDFVLSVFTILSNIVASILAILSISSLEASISLSSSYTHAILLLEL